MVVVKSNILSLYTGSGPPYRRYELTKVQPLPALSREMSTCG